MLAAMLRQPEPELMDLVEEAVEYATADFSAVNAAFVDRVIKLVGSDDPAIHLLDLGCGPGEIPIELAKRQPGWSITAVDGSRAMLTIAQANGQGRPNVRWVLDDVKTLTLVDESFDVIISNSLLHHLPDPLPFWAQVIRVSRPGTLLLLRDLVRPGSVDEATRIVQTYAGAESALLQEEFHRSLLSAFTLEEVREQLKRAGIDGMTVEMSSDRHLDVYGKMTGGQLA